MKDPFRIYEERYAWAGKLGSELPVSGKLELAVTIPCFNESDLLKSLESLYSCNQPGCDVEILILVNEPENAPPEVRNLNRDIYRKARAWSAENSVPEKKFIVFRVDNLPPASAGVGLARKIIMDEAARRLVKSGHPEGIIVGFDADCQCDPNYLQAIYDEFKEKKLNGASLYFEHDLPTGVSGMGIAGYELHLRYYIHASRYAGFPYAFHTIGSCMAVRADIYHRQGGMNQRKAGEDFYFLHKVIPLGKFGEINSTTVRPSSRISARVPFGTGKAMLDWSASQENEFKTYHPGIFEELANLLHKAEAIMHMNEVEMAGFSDSLPPCLGSFLADQNFMEHIRNAQKKTATVQTGKDRFFIWFNGLKVLRFVHYATKEKYGWVPVGEAIDWLDKKLDIAIENRNKPVELLGEIRKYDREHPWFYDKQ